ncbi:MAG: ATP-binding protein [Nitrospirota bacterium]
MNPYAIFPLISAVLFGAAGLFVYSKDTKSGRNRLFALICMATVFWQGTWFVLFQFPHPNLIMPLVKMGYTSIIFLPIAIYHFAVSFLHVEKDKKFIQQAYLIGLFFLITLHTSDLYISGSYQYFFGFYPKAGLVLHPLYLIFLTVIVGRAIYLLFLSTREPSLPKAVYRQRRLLLIAFFIYTMASVDFLVNYGVAFYPFGVVFILIALGIIGYAIISYHLLDISTIAHKTAAWLTTSSAVLIPVIGIFYTNYPAIATLSQLGLSLLVAATGLLLIPYVKWILPHVDHFFGRRKYDLEAISQAFIRDISVLKTPKALIAAFEETITKVLYPENVSILLFNIREEKITPPQFIALDTAFPIASHTIFLEWLKKNDHVVNRETVALNPQYHLVADAISQYFLATEAVVIVPLIHDQKLFCVINMGPKKNLTPYTQDEIDFLSNLKIEGAIAISNALLYADVHDMSETLRQWARELETRVMNQTHDLQESNRQIEESYIKLQEMDRLKSRFFANVSHELRTPITLLMGPTEMLLQSKLGAITEDQERYLSIIHSHSMRLLRLINSLLDLSKADAGKAKLFLERGNFVSFVKQIVDSTLPLVEEKSIHLSFEADEAIPEFLYDQGKIEDILLNLLSNALKFTEQGEIRVSCTRQWNNVLVKIADTGVGIPEESLSKLFDRFFQVDTAASQVGVGAGIGLSLVKEWVEIHKGRIWVESKEGLGSSFFFTIPIRMEEVVDSLRMIERRKETSLVKSSSLIQAQMGLEGHQKTKSFLEIPFREGVEMILLVDDSPDMLRFMSDQLKDHYNLLFARDGQEGVQTARAKHPHLIISDVMMPIKDGYQLCREIKGSPETATIPIILLTAKGNLSDKIEGLEQGADDYLTKPFNQEELYARIRSLLHKRYLQEEVSLKNRQLEDALLEIKRIGRDMMQSEKMASLGLLISGIAHELNNPVSFAKGSLLVASTHCNRLAEQGPADHQQFSEDCKEIQESLHVVKSGLARVESVIKNLSIFIRKDEEIFSPVDLHESLDLTLSLLQYEWLDGVVVHRNYGAILPVEVIPGEINQSFLNIIQNALHAMEGCQNKDLSIETRLVGESILIAICDTGVGIPDENIPRLFEPFFTTKETGKGTGLGLSLVYKMIVENHHGTIDIKSKVHEGTEFIITLPLKMLV